MFADPGFIEIEIVKMLDELKIAFEGERGICVLAMKWR